MMTPRSLRNGMRDRNAPRWRGSTLVVILLSCLAFPGRAQPPPTAKVVLGIDVLLEEQLKLVAGKRLGLVTNPSGVDARLVQTADRLAEDERCRLVQLYGPEHGIRGDVPAGDKVKDEVDPLTGVSVQSLYGKTRRPSKKSLKGVDLLLFDIQDVGSRTYTYVSTLGETMIAAAEAGLPLAVLDRPNPLGGQLFEGPVREDKWKSFIGWGPVPVTHGMTFGEIARFYNAELNIGCDLRVVRMKGWKREMMWEDTGLTWVQTSPHIPHALQAHLYVATGMIGGITKNVNEGVGYTLPFETIAAEFIEPRRLAAALEAERLPGVRFRPISYRPSYFSFEGKVLRGVQLLPEDFARFRPLRTALTILVALERLYPGKVEFKGDRNFAIHWGNLDVLKMIRSGRKVADIEASWAGKLKRFAERRRRYLLYE